MPGPTLAGKVTLDDSQAAAALRRIETIGAAAAAKLQGSVGGALKSFASPIAAIGPAIAAAFASKAIVSGVANVFDAGRAMQVLSRQTGAGVAGLVVLQAKFRQAGIDVDGVGTAIFRLQKSLNGVEDEENKGGAGRLAQLGLNLAAIKQLSPDRQLMAVGQAISSIANPAERTAAAMQIFGKSGAQLNAVFGPGFAQVAPALQQKAEMMAKNAAIFEQVSIKLSKVGGVLKTFYVGVADQVATSLLPILSQIEKINLVGMGQKFGAAIADAGKMFVGGFQLPETALLLIENGLASAFTGAGNVLLASLKTGVDFFHTGMLASLEGIGSAIIATLTRSFESPIARLQAMIELAMRAAPAKQDADLVTDLRKERDQVATNAQGRRYTPAETSHLKAINRQVAEIQNKYRSPLSISERAEQIEKAGVKFGLYDGGQSSEQWAQRGRDNLQEAFAAAKAAAGNFKIEDVLGSSKYQEAAAKAAMALRQRGQMMLGTGSAAPGGGGMPSTPGTGLSKAAGDRLTAAAHMALVSSRVAIGSDPASFMFTGHSGLFGTARTNASDPYTARVDAARRADMVASHTIGLGGALDFNPSSRPGWTGAREATRVGGLGGAYGATGNIWNQVSGRVSGGSKSPEQHLAGIYENTKALADSVKGNGTTGGGGGPTTTGK